MIVGLLEYNNVAMAAICVLKKKQKPCASIPIMLVNTYKRGNYNHHPSEITALLNTNSWWHLTLNLNSRYKKVLSSRVVFRKQPRSFGSFKYVLYFALKWNVLLSWTMLDSGSYAKEKNRYKTYHFLLMLKFYRFIKYLSL